MFRFVLIAAVLALAAPCFAGSEANCREFAAAFKKAGKAAGSEPDANTVASMKKDCAKKTDEAVKKQTACLDKAKTDGDLADCFH